MKCALSEFGECNKLARKRFCCNKHKDRYHNLKNPRGIKAHLRGVPLPGKHVDEGPDMPESWDEHKDEFGSNGDAHL